MLNDPLIQYLKKQATEVETNEDDSTSAPKEPEPTTHEDPEPPAELATQGTDPHREYLKKIFSARKGIRPKYEAKDHSATTGMVDKALKS